ncbi:MAG: fibrillarin-like rRNA/tRNA 2'-O-methyltransferase [Candidatus Woesearchaeota archaeon]
MTRKQRTVKAKKESGKNKRNPKNKERMRGKLPPNTIRISGQLATLNYSPGESHLGETRIITAQKEYRIWDPKTSKLAAALHKGIDYPSTVERPIILYLGASYGNTVSHLSDIYPQGIIYAVESAIEPIRQMAILSIKRKNILPLYANAGIIGDYSKIMPYADIIYMDIAQKNQVDILRKNMIFASDNTIIMLCLKARSIDVTMPPSTVFLQAKKQIQEYAAVIREMRLEPYEKDHAFMILKKKVG